MVSTFYKGSDGCMLAFDVTDRESFEALDNWRDDFLEKVIPREQDFPMVVLGNKIDLSDRQVRVEEGEQEELCWSHNSWRDLKVVKVWHLGTWFSAGLTAGLGLEGFFRPKQFHDCVIGVLWHPNGFWGLIL